MEEVGGYHGTSLKQQTGTAEHKPPLLFAIFAVRCASAVTRKMERPGMFVAWIQAPQGAGIDTSARMATYAYVQSRFCSAKCASLHNDHFVTDGGRISPFATRQPEQSVFVALIFVIAISLIFAFWYVVAVVQYLSVLIDCDSQESLVGLLRSDEGLTELLRRMTCHFVVRRLAAGLAQIRRPLSTCNGFAHSHMCVWRRKRDDNILSALMLSLISERPLATIFYSIHMCRYFQCIVFPASAYVPIFVRAGRLGLCLELIESEWRHI
uniref:Transmembrane protein n=1 Tax=Steinernema glaseri TaxID=37863 RepID=A0A1I7Z254_9BILA